MQENRGSFTGNIGFILAAAGAAVGLGNIWRFPYLAGSSGGGFFILFYLILVVIMGIPIMLGEHTLGRFGQADAMQSYVNVATDAGSKRVKAWKTVGFFGVICSFVILTYYAVVGGWVVEYMVKAVTMPLSSLNGDVFVESITAPVSPVVYTFVFSLATALIVYFGVEKGIEKSTKVMMPALFIMLIIVAIRSLTLPGAIEGVKFLFVPNVENLKASGGIGKVLLYALGQCFFSLALGQGIMVTYGSYLKKDVNLPKNATIVPLLDTSVALLSGLAVLPAVFAFGMEPTSGPGLIFATLPQVFNNFGPVVGPAFCFIFFTLVLFAALTSSISLLEVVVSYVTGTLKFKRSSAVWSMAGVIFLISIVCSLSNGMLSGIVIFGLNIFDALGWMTDKIFMPFLTIFMCILLGYVWGPDKAKKEVTNEGAIPFKLFDIWMVLIKFILPVLIFIIFITGLLG